MNCALSNHIDPENKDTLHIGKVSEAGGDEAFMPNMVAGP